MLRKQPQNFTLLEVMFVLVIMGAVFFPLLQMLSNGLLASNEVRGTNTAVMIAQKTLEVIKNTSFASIASAPKAAVAGHPGYSNQVVVTTPKTNLKDVSVIVYWLPGEGSESNISVETYVANF